MDSVPEDGLLNVPTETNPPDIIRNSRSFSSLKQDSENPAISSLLSVPLVASTQSIQKDRDSETASGSKSTTQRTPVLGIGQRSKEVGGQQGGGSPFSASPPCRRKSSIFNNMLRRVSIHRKESTPNGRIATFFFGSGNPDDDDDDDDEQGKQGLLVHETWWMQLGWVGWRETG